MNPNPDEHFPLRKLYNTQLTDAIVRSAAIRGEAGILITREGVLRPLRMHVALCPEAPNLCQTQTKLTHDTMT